MTKSLFFTYQGVTAFSIDDTGAYYYTTNQMALDADGSPNAYNPDNTGLDALANAGYPHGEWADCLVADPNNPSHPYIQPDGPHAGCFVSMTTLANPNYAHTDPAKYVDATSVPYIVFPGFIYAKQGTGSFGSIGIVRNLSNGLQSGFVIADEGNYYETLGEVSLCLAERLGGSNLNARNGMGQPNGPFQYVIFPRLHISKQWPLTEDTINQLAIAQLKSVGGWPSV